MDQWPSESVVDPVLAPKGCEVSIVDGRCAGHPWDDLESGENTVDLTIPRHNFPSDRSCFNQTAGIGGGDTVSFKTANRWR